MFFMSFWAAFYPPILHFTPLPPERANISLKMLMKVLSSFPFFFFFPQNLHDLLRAFCLEMVLSDLCLSQSRAPKLIHFAFVFHCGWRTKKKWINKEERSLVIHRELWRFVSSSEPLCLEPLYWGGLSFHKRFRLKPFRKLESLTIQRSIILLLLKSISIKGIKFKTSMSRCKQTKCGKNSKFVRGNMRHDTKSLISSSVHKAGELLP